MLVKQAGRKHKRVEKKGPPLTAAAPSAFCITVK